MIVRTKKQPMTPQRFIKPLAWMFMAFYLGYHALHGERGLYALMREKHELAQLQQEYAQKSSGLRRELADFCSRLQMSKIDH